MVEFTAFVQLVTAVVVGVYFFARLRSESESQNKFKSEYKREAENLNRMRKIKLTEPMAETARPKKACEIIGQADGMRALRAALWGKNPQHVLIYGPPGVGKTAAARIILDEVKESPQTPFLKNAPFIETDATIMRCDEHGFTNPLIGSVHDPIYQGSGSFGQNGIPQPMPGAVTRAHGGILFLDEIGELPNEQINKLLKVLEDRRVRLESSYYNVSDKKIPTYIRDVFENGLPADFRLIGATTSPPEKIPEAVRSRCVEVYFSDLSRDEILKIIYDCAKRCGMNLANGAAETAADFAKNGREAVKILQSSQNISKMDGRGCVSISDVIWVAKNGRYRKRDDISGEFGGKIIDISLIKPYNQ